MSDNDVHDLIVIGGGPAGYTAALYSARANLRPLVIEGFAWGGQLMITSDVENYPGYPDGIMGPEMMQDFRRQAERFGAEFLTDDVTSVDFSERPFRVYVDDKEYRAEAVIVATGASARQLGLESERALQGRGVSYCAVCDAAFFREKEVVVVGGGDSAMEEAIFLTKFATKVSLVHRRDEFRASQIMLDRARANPKIEWITNATVDEVVAGEGGQVTAVRIRDLETDELRELPAQGLFVAIGHDPNTKLFVDQLDHDEAGYLVTHDGTATNIPGVFAAGDVVDHVYRQAVTAAGMGTMAALDAERWLAAQGRPRRHHARRTPAGDCRGLAGSRASLGAWRKRTGSTCSTRALTSFGQRRQRISRRPRSSCWKRSRSTRTSRGRRSRATATTSSASSWSRSRFPTRTASTTRRSTWCSRTTRS